MKNIMELIREELDRNNNKIGKDFVDYILSECKESYFHPTPSMRLCILTLPTGHELLGKSQVLDPLNDKEDIGNKVAKDNAADQIWSLIGTLAKAL